MKPKPSLLLLLVPSLVFFLTLYGWLAGSFPLFVRSYHGKLYLLFIDPDAARLFAYEANPREMFSLRDWIKMYKSNAPRKFEAAGFEFFHGPDYTVLAIPYPLLVLVAAALTFWSFMIHRRRRRQRLRSLNGLCPACGYDLRSITSGRCPECGAEASPA